jgi:hypothetical protein
VIAFKKTTNLLKRDAENWKIRFNGVEASCPDSIGMSYIHQLIKSSFKEMHATVMVTKKYGEPVEIMEAGELVESGVSVTNDDSDDVNGDQAGQVVTTEFADEILSDEDRAYVLKGLENEYARLATLQSKGLPREVLLKKEEIRIIEKYLKDHRYGYKNVCFENRANRDRKSVSIAIIRAIKQITEEHPSFADHLRAAVSTGTYCSYTPSPNTIWAV